MTITAKQAGMWIHIILNLIPLVETRQDQILLKKLTDMGCTKDRIAKAIAAGWILVPPRTQFRGGVERVVEEEYWYHPQTDRKCYVAAQLPD